MFRFLLGNNLTIESNYINLQTRQELQHNLVTPGEHMYTSLTEPKEEHLYSSTSTSTLPVNTTEIYNYDYVDGNKIDIVKHSPSADFVCNLCFRATWEFSELHKFGLILNQNHIFRIYFASLCQLCSHRH